MGFWDTYVDEGGSGYVSADEKAAMIANGVVFKITSVREDDENQFQGKPNPRYVTTILLANSLTGEEEERLLAFSKIAGGSSRDRQLEAMIEYLDGGEEPVSARLGKVGNFVTIEAA